MSDEPTHEELIEQAKAVLESVRATMYYPVAHGEAEKLQTMIEEKVDQRPNQSFAEWVRDRKNEARGGRYRAFYEVWLEMKKRGIVEEDQDV